MKKSTGRRLWQYALLYKKTIIWALVLLLLAVSAELAGPFIAKRMIDQNILGVEKPWFEVEADQPYAVEYDGRWFKRQDRLVDVPQSSEVRILQKGRMFYFINEPLAFESGRREVSDGIMTITSKETGESVDYPAKALTVSEMYEFYKPEFAGIIQLALLYVGLLVIASFFSYGQRYMLQASANRIVQKMRNDVYEHTQRLPVQYYDNLAAGQVVSRITNDTEAVRQLFITVLSNFVLSVVYMVAIFGALFLLNVRLALFTLPIIPLLFLWVVIYRKYASTYNQIIRAKLSEINGMLNEAIQGMPIIQAFRRQKEMKEEFEELNEYHYRYQSKLLKLNSITSHNLIGFIRNLMFFFLLWFFWGDWLGSLVTVGVLYAYVDYMNRMFSPIVGFVSQLSTMETALVSAERVFVLMDEAGVDVDDGQMPRYKGEVCFDKVSFAYKADERVLHNVSFVAKQGETVALVGHTGSGKSSIMNLLFRFYDTTEGSITVDGKDIRNIPHQQLRAHMGIVLQDPYLFTGTIATNISLNNADINREKVVQSLKDVGAYEMFSSLPEGIDTPIIEKGSTLSAGQRQLISFARALAYDPAILILDEATASIDSETEAIIQQALEVLKRGRTTFVIAHRLSTIRSADKILVLDHGHIIERGDHDELMEQQGKYYAMYQLQQGAAS